MEALSPNDIEAVAVLPLLTASGVGPCLDLTNVTDPDPVITHIAVHVDEANAAIVALTLNGEALAQFQPVLWNIIGPAVPPAVDVAPTIDDAVVAPPVPVNVRQADLGLWIPLRLLDQSRGADPLESWGLGVGPVVLVDER